MCILSSTERGAGKKEKVVANNLENNWEVRIQKLQKQV